MIQKKITQKPKVISLFTGAMGLDLGVELAGFDVIACVENEKICIETIKNNRPNVKIYPEDINLVDPLQILSDLELRAGDVELVVGGPPCQPFSTAGKRRSLHDFRGNVIVRFLDYVKSIKPKYFILENVRGIYSAKLSNTPPEYQEYKKLEEIPGSVVYFLYREFQKLGYSISFNLFDSSLYSVPQRRERFIMFGTISSSPVELPIPTSTHQVKTLADTIKKIQDGQHDYVKLRENHIKYLKLLKGGQYWKDLPLELQAEAMGKSFHLGGGKTGFYRRLSWDKPSPTLVTSPTMPATMLVHPEKMRPLSIQEYALIQQFPANWKFAGKTINIYKQIGNAVPVGLGFAAGKAIQNHRNKVRKQSINILNHSRYKKTSHFEFIPNFEKNHLKKSHTSKQLSVFELDFAKQPPYSD